jgi:gentisate 1,2-dioxygenase
MESGASFEAPAVTPERQRFYDRLDRHGVAPLWNVLSRLVPPHPAPDTQPVLFRYDDMRPLLLEAGALLTAQEAERRVLVLENPAFRGQSRITQSLYAGLQLILPGETASRHRHVASALRFVLEGDGAYTSVDGERTTMRPGDFILTPSWTWHDHGNPGSQPVVWLDGLDVPIVNLFDSSFMDRAGEETALAGAPEGTAAARYGANMLPVDVDATRQASPLFAYPYARTREALESLRRHGPIDPCHGVRLRYTNPATGGYPMPTIGAFMQLLPKTFRGQPCRSTDATLFCVVEGRGTSRIGERTVAWTPRDIFVAPSWAPVSHQASEDAVIFSMSDRPAQLALGLWRESRE